jgi:hypothetical protein
MSRSCDASASLCSVQCHECGQSFEFAGIFEGPGVKLSADRREWRGDITEAQK